MHRLSKLQAEILDALARQVEEGGVNIQGLADAFGIHRLTMREHLDAIARKGHLELESRGPGKNPIIKLRYTGVPIVGQIAAGSLSEALEFPKATCNCRPTLDASACGCRAIRWPRLIQDGDVVLLKKRPPKAARSARCGSTEATPP